MSADTTDPALVADLPDDLSALASSPKERHSLTLDQLAPNPHKREPFFWQKEKPAFSFGPSGTAVHVDD